MAFMQKLINPDFLFTQVTASDFKSLLPSIILFGGLIILTILSIIIFRKTDPVTGKIKGKINTWMTSLGIIGFVIIFFRWQQMGFLAKNFTIELISLIWFIWLVFIIIYVLRKFPKEAKLYQERQRIKKYLPKSRKKNN
jgi:multisubunit Na+/H+ antiporter MnhG subunit